MHGLSGLASRVRLKTTSLDHSPRVHAPSIFVSPAKNGWLEHENVSGLNNVGGCTSCGVVQWCETSAAAQRLVTDVLDRPTQVNVTIRS
jgi:hypothetical protein